MKSTINAPVFYLSAILLLARDGVIGDILDQYERHRHFVHVVR